MSEDQETPIEKLGPYRIVREIGKGGMGTVYQAVDQRSGDTVAVKVLPPELARQRSFLNRFAHELEALEKLDHPNITKVLDVGRDDLTHYFVVEYVPGGSLEQYLVENPRLEADQACRIACDVARALAHAHAHGIVHRDVKPANILMGENNSAKLTDFGIAKMTDATRLTMTGAVVGTADYLSPEQAEGRRVTPRSDLYSLGIMLYRMLAGRAPFSGRTTVEIVQKHRFARPTALYEFRPGLPSRLYELVDELIRKSPSERPPNGQVVAERLERILSRLQGEPDDNAWERRMAQRVQARLAERRIAAVRAGCYVLGAMLVTLLAWWLSLPPSPEQLWAEVQNRAAAGDRRWAMANAYRVWKERGDTALGTQARKLYRTLLGELLAEARAEAAAGADRVRRLRAVFRAARGTEVKEDAYETAADEAIKAAEKLQAHDQVPEAIAHFRAIAVLFAEQAANQAKAAKARADALMQQSGSAGSPEAPKEHAREADSM